MLRTKKALSVLPRLFSRRSSAFPNARSVPITARGIDIRTVLVATFTTFSLCLANNTLSADEGTVDLTNDGGIKKKVITEGQGASPPRGARVKVHYVGTLTNGKKVISAL
jgi:hypothetical protein